MAFFTINHPKETVVELSLKSLKTILSFLTTEDLEEIQVFIDKLLEG